MKPHATIKHPELAPGTVLLETLQALPGLPNRSFLFTHPVTTLTPNPGETMHEFLTRAEAWRKTHWLAGYVAFEAAHEQHGLPAPNLPYPMAWFGVYEHPQEVAAPYAFHTPKPPVALWRLTAEQPDHVFAASMQRVIDQIHAGHLTEVNITGRLYATDPGSLLARYRALTKAQPTAFNAAITFETAAGETVEIASLSPELFYTVDTSGPAPRIAMRPMKGTVHRGATEAEDEELAQWLYHDPKNREENLVIAKSLVNELTQVTKPGTAGITERFTLEPYHTVWQMTSTVAGEATTTKLPELFTALFPCGSIAGPPKTDMLRLIHNVEHSPRGVYTGAIGFAAPDGSSTFSVAIRTLTKVGSHLEYGIGSGIVAGSNAHDEVREWHLKAAFLPRAERAGVGLIETLRFDPAAGLVRREAHMARLQQSAAWLGITVDERGLTDALAGVTSAVALRVRIEVQPAGTIVLTTAPLESDNGPFTVAVAETPVERANPFLAHKTTMREQFTAATQFAAAHGFADIIFTNEDGEITEGAISNVFVQRNGVLITPPVTAGLLPGVLRAELLANGTAQEGTLYPADLAGADVFIGNSLRGLRKVVVQPGRVTIS